MKHIRLKNDSGIILFVTLWILAILSALALGLGRWTNIELSLAKNYAGKVRSKQAAIAGLTYTLDKIAIIAPNAAAEKVDTKFQCGFELGDNQEPEDIFKKVPLGAGYFDVFYREPDETGKKIIHYGLSDEDGKININTLTPDTHQILTELIMEFGNDSKTAETIASSVIDWRDSDAAFFNLPYGAEEDYYISQTGGVHCKNGPFESIEELMLVREMTPEIFKEIKNYITVYPKEGPFLINLDTASLAVLRAFARSLSGARTNTTLEDADSLIDKLILYRKGVDDREVTADDRMVDLNEMGLNAKERVIALLMETSRQKTSQYLRVHIKGTDEQSKSTTELEAIVQRSDLAIVRWHRN